jgi:hypothetical protein
MPMDYSDELIERYQKYYKEKGGEEMGRDEANLALGNLAGLFTVLADIAWTEKKLEAKLEEFPKGYAIMDGKTYTCFLCGISIKDEELWYDKWGKKCLTCQKAINRKVVPGSACKDRESRYKAWELESSFKLTRPSIRKLVKEGILKERKVLNQNGRVHERLFLLKDNKGILPPKKLLESTHVPIRNNTFRVIQWYDYQEPAVVLKDYKLYEHLRELQEYCLTPLKTRFREKMPK